MDNADDENIDIQFTQFPVGAVHRQDPVFAFRKKLNNQLTDLGEVNFKTSEETLDTFILKKFILAAFHWRKSLNAFSIIVFSFMTMVPPLNKDGLQRHIKTQNPEIVQ